MKNFIERYNKALLRKSDSTTKGKKKNEKKIDFDFVNV